MAYNRDKIYQQAEEVSLSKGFQLLDNKFNSEKEFEENLLPKLERIINEMYGLDIESIETQKFYSLKEQGYYQAKLDIFITTKQGVNIVIESKNPIHEKTEIINSFSQLMSYQFLLEKHGIDAIYILATSVFDFKYIEYMKRFKIKYDIIVNNKTSAGFWINDL